MNYPKLYIVRGIPGAGKSTFVKEKLIPKLSKHVSKNRIRHFEADMFFMEDGEYNFDGSKLWLAHRWCQDQTRKSFELDCADFVIVSNTFTTMYEIAPYIQIARDHGASYEIYKCNGGFKNIHNVPDEAIQKMVDRWQDINGEIEV